MRIMITNDDGITAPGLAVLKSIADEIAGPSGEVWTIAPATEQSGVGHTTSYNRPTAFFKVGARVFAVEGSPADCVILGLHEILKDTPPDLVLSGVNRGNNAAENVLYSGTIGAAIEAALQGHRAIALSQFYGPENRDLANPFEAASEHGVSIVQRLLGDGDWTPGGYRLFYNVNFPPTAAKNVKGTRVAAQGFRPDSAFKGQKQDAPSGRAFFWVSGGPQHTPSAPGTDAAVNLEGHISITPMRCELTAHDALDQLEARLNDG